MLKEINQVTIKCLANRGVIGCCDEIKNRMFSYLCRVLEEGKDWKEVVVSFEVKYNATTKR